MSKPWLSVAVFFGAFAFTATAWSTADAGTPNRCAGDERLEHLIVIFDENVSFDHYFGTYPKADPPFNAKPDTPSVNGLSTLGLWENNPNSTKPFRLRHDQYATSDQDHGYTAEQEAFDNGLMDLFPESTGNKQDGPGGWGKGTGIVMGVYDGNTVTALRNYAQNFAMSDNSFGTTFGPSTPGALNLVAGRTGLVTGSNGKSSTGYLAHSAAGDVLIDDADPLDDICANPNVYQARLTGKNIGDLLTGKIT
jgi:phospholipase C